MPSSDVRRRNDGDIDPADEEEMIARGSSRRDEINEYQFAVGCSVPRTRTLQVGGKTWAGAEAGAGAGAGARSQEPGAVVRGPWSVVRGVLLDRFMVA